MVSVEEASNIIFSNLCKVQTKDISIHDAVGRILAENIFADRDFPPFNRVAMDGVAISYINWLSGTRKYFIANTQAAGVPKKKLTNPNQCMEVMTGAILPDGTDTVIRYEDLKIENGYATLCVEELHLRQNVHAQGQDALHGHNLLEPGILISPAEIALLASVGKSKVSVYAFPKTALVSTGDELIDITETPAPHQIRKSNVFALAAAMKQVGWETTPFHLSDDKQFLEESLETIAATHDVLVLSGGVSKGKFDFIPEVLAAIGVQKLFHQVMQRPGKPFWFGTSNNDKVVFALPGNPVSTYLCFYKYIKPWILKSFGVKAQYHRAFLATDFTFTPQLTYFLQVRVAEENGRLVAHPIVGGGSGDFANLKNVTGFVELPANQITFKPGDLLNYLPFRPI